MHSPSLTIYQEHPTLAVDDCGNTHRALIVHIGGEDWLAVPDFCEHRAQYAPNIPSDPDRSAPNHFSGCVGCEFDAHPISRGLKHRGRVPLQAQGNCIQVRNMVTEHRCMGLFQNPGGEPSGAIYIRVEDFDRYTAVRTALRMGADPRPQIT